MEEISFFGRLMIVLQLFSTIFFDLASIFSFYDPNYSPYNKCKHNYHSRQYLNDKSLENREGRFVEEVHFKRWKDFEGMEGFFDCKTFFFSDSERIFPLECFVAYSDCIATCWFIFFSWRTVEVCIACEFFVKICSGKFISIDFRRDSIIVFSDVEDKIRGLSRKIWDDNTHIQKKSSIHFNLIDIWLAMKIAVERLRNLGILYLDNFIRRHF